MSRSNSVREVNGSLLSWPQDALYSMTNGINPHEAFEKANGNKFNEYSYAYVWTNEPMRPLLDIADYSGRKVLGIAAGGDQALIFFLGGAKSYLGFDISKLSCMWSEFKVAAVRNLSYNEFNAFFKGKGKDDLYSKVRQDLSTPARFFFDHLMKGSDGTNVSPIIKSKPLFWSDSYSLYCNHDGKKFNFDQDQETYNKTKKRLCKGTYRTILLSLDDILETENSGFDTIFLSNVPDYAMKSEKDARRFIPKLDAALPVGGQIIAYFEWRAPDDVAKVCKSLGYEIKILPARNKILCATKKGKRLGSRIRNALSIK